MSVVWWLALAGGLWLAVFVTVLSACVSGAPLLLFEEDERCDDWAEVGFCAACGCECAYGDWCWLDGERLCGECARALPRRCGVPREC